MENSRHGLGPNSVTVASVAIELARVHLDRGDYAAAEPLLRDAVGVMTQVCPEGSWRIASTKGLLGLALAGLGRTAEAEPLLADASRGLRDLPGPPGRQQEVVDLIEQAGATGGVSLVELGGAQAQSWSTNGDTKFAAASTYKLPLLMEEAQLLQMLEKAHPREIVFPHAALRGLRQPAGNELAQAG